MTRGRQSGSIQRTPVRARAVSSYLDPTERRLSSLGEWGQLKETRSFKDDKRERTGDAIGPYEFNAHGRAA